MAKKYILFKPSGYQKSIRVNLSKKSFLDPSTGTWRKTETVLRLRKNYVKQRRFHNRIINSIEYAGIKVDYRQRIDFPKFGTDFLRSTGRFKKANNALTKRMADVERITTIINLDYEYATRLEMEKKYAGGVRLGNTWRDKYGNPIRPLHNIRQDFIKLRSRSFKKEASSLIKLAKIVR